MPTPGEMNSAAPRFGGGGVAGENNSPDLNSLRVSDQAGASGIYSRLLVIEILPLRDLPTRLVRGQAPRMPL